MSDDIQERLHRLYAALGAIEESDPDKLRADVYQSEKAVFVFQDFRAGQSDAELMNQATSLIYNIANLYVLLGDWAGKNGFDKSEVKKVVDECHELKIIRDLADYDRHPFPPRNGGLSGKSPTLVNINRVMRMQTQAKAGSWVSIVMGPGGRPIFGGDGTHKAVVTGDVVDGNKNTIGDFYEIAVQSIKAWEQYATDRGSRIAEG
jgi:hypothetical protein